jgi:hypothetical protein
MANDEVAFYAGPSTEDCLPGARLRDARFSWDANAVPAGTLLPGERRPNAAMGVPRGVRIALVTVAVAVLAGIGGVVWWSMYPGSEKESIAAHFRSSAPVVSVGGLDGGLGSTVVGDVPDTVEYAAAALRVVDPSIQAANAGLVATEEAFDAWAAGRLDDDELITSTRELMDTMGALTEALDNPAIDVPQSLATAYAQLDGAASGYRTSLSDLDDYLTSHSKIARMGFWVGVAHANVDWDSAVQSAYTTAGMPAPLSPHQH